MLWKISKVVIPVFLSISGFLLAGRIKSQESDLYLFWVCGFMGFIAPSLFLSISKKSTDERLLSRFREAIEYVWNAPFFPFAHYPIEASIFSGFNLIVFGLSVFMKLNLSGDPIANAFVPVTLGLGLWLGVCVCIFLLRREKRGPEWH
jgi:vacuolar-type H+-ATPase subunit I/STV1